MVAARLAYPRMSRKEFSRRLAPLSGEERASVLGPLRDEDIDTRQLIQPLLRDLGLLTELTPAGTLEGGGAEVSAEVRPLARP